MMTSSCCAGQGEFGWSLLGFKPGRRQSKTETDTKVIAQPIENTLNGRLVDDVVRKSVQQLRGDDSLAILSSKEPNKIPLARFGPPSATALGHGNALWPVMSWRFGVTQATSCFLPTMILPYFPPRVCE